MSSSLLIIQEWEKTHNEARRLRGLKPDFPFRGCCLTPPHDEGSHAQLATCCLKLLTLMAQHTRFLFLLLQEIVQPHYNHPTGDKTKLHHDVGLCVLKNYEKSLPLISFRVEGAHSFSLIKRLHILILFCINSKLLSDRDFKKFLSSSVRARRLFSLLIRLICLINLLNEF